MERAEFEAFFEENDPKLVHSLMRRGAPLHIAEELAMEVMTRLYERRAEINLPKNWTWATAHRELPTVMQKERRYVPTGDSREDKADPSAAVEEHGVEKVQVAQLFQLLPEAQQQVLALHYDDFKTAEIARMLEMPENTVRSNLRHGRARLKKELEKDF